MLNRTFYLLEPNEFGKSDVGKITIVTLAAIRNLFFLNLIIIFSFLTLFEFRKYLDRKLKICSKPSPSIDLKVNRNITVTVISISFVFIIGHLPYAIAFIISIVKTDYLPYALICFRIFCFVMLFTAHGFNIFIYYFSNKIFRKILRNIFHNCTKKVTRF